MMIPITRKEKYINEIVGGGNTAPETPQTREELFYAAILGEVVAPSPITRVEKYLSAIAGQYNGELPEPVTRIERFIARAAGMDVTIPMPITREEMLWANYALIVEKELSGIPPLTFTAKKTGTLKNYRIYGNTVDGESVGNLVTDSHSEHYGKYAIPVTTNSETANIFIDEPLRMVGDEAEYVDYKEQKQHRVRKNLVQTIATSQTINDITFTVNANGSVTCNGTNHGNNPILFELNNPDVVFPEGVYITSGCPAGGSITSGYKIQYFNGSSWNYELGSGSTFTLSGNLKYRSRILISKDVTVTNLTFYPMLRLASIEDDTYEPYIEDTEVDVILPGIAVTAGTNTLTVGTEVQPSNVYIKYEGAR